MLSELGGTGSEQLLISLHAKLNEKNLSYLTIQNIRFIQRKKKLHFHYIIYHIFSHFGATLETSFRLFEAHDFAFQQSHKELLNIQRIVRQSRSRQIVVRADTGSLRNFVIG